MNSSQNIAYSENILYQTNGGMVSELDSQFSNRLSSQNIDMDPQGLGLAKQSRATLGKFESTFYATERNMGFDQNDFQVGNYPFCYSRTNESPFSNLYQSPKDRFSIEVKEQTQLYGNRFNRSMEKLDQIPDINFSCCISGENKFSGDDTMQPDMNFARVLFGSYRSSYQQEKMSPRISLENYVFSGYSFSAAPAQSSKTRIRWTQDLHEKFVDCVNRLGGAEKATPKAILKLMDSHGLTIFHVKSHLQKYRIAKYMPDFTEGKTDQRGAVMTDVPDIDPKTGVQIKEALQVQLDVQRCLHEQLEIQRNMQLRIEEQGKQLKMMFDQQQRKTNSMLMSQTTNSTSTFSTENLEVSTAEEFSNKNTLYPSKIS